MILTGIDGDAVVSGVERYILTQNVAAGVGVEPVVVGTDAIDGDATHDQVGTPGGVVLPEWCVLRAVILHQHVGAAEQLDHAGPEVVTQAENTALHGDIRFGERRQVVLVALPGSLRIGEPGIKVC